MKKSLNLNYGISPNPVLMVSAGDYEKPNIVTVAWAGVINSEPMLVYIALRKCRYSNALIGEKREFVINLPSADLVKVADYCGTKSGRDIDKFEECNLKKGRSRKVDAPYIEDCKIALECKVQEIKNYPSHDIFIAEVVNVLADEDIIDENGMIDFKKANLLSYATGKYFACDSEVGFRGMGVK